MSSVVIAGDTSGTVTLAAPAVSGTTTLTLPATSGTVLTTGSTGQVINKASLPTGSVLQVVTGSYGTTVSSSTSTLVNTGLTASITPTSNTSKILVLVYHNACAKGASNSALRIALLRGASIILNIDDGNCYTATTTALYGNGAIAASYLDSPATTSSTTYSTQFCSSTNNAVVYVQNYYTAYATSTITLMEIAA